MGLRGDMFYEIHPQLWNKGIMSEAFDEVLRFAIETVGCVKVIVSPSHSLDFCGVWTGGLLG